MTMIGVLSLQGDFAEHTQMLERCGADVINVKRSFELERIDGLIIPGGESTAIAKLTADNTDPIFAAIKEKAYVGMPIYGTCMGSIFLAKQIDGSSQGRLALMDIDIRRNAFGPQKFSFEQYVDIPVLGAKPFLAVFIRAPMILSCGSAVAVLARTQEGIVMASQGNMLVSAFHPEITGDLRVHEYFLSMVDRWRSGQRESARMQMKHNHALHKGMIVKVRA